MKLSILTSALAASAVVSALPSNPNKGPGNNNGKAIGKGLKGPHGKPGGPHNGGGNGGGHGFPGKPGKPGPEKKPLVSSKKLTNDIKEQALKKLGNKLEDLSELSAGNRTRVIGSEGHKATVQWVLDNLKPYDDYYSYYTQDFDVTTSSGDISVNGQELPSQVMTFSAGGEVTADLVNVANLGCDAADFPAEVSGKIALIQRGTCAFGDKATNAKAAGAIGAVIYNNEPGVVAGTLGGEGDYPATIGISDTDGQRLKASIAAGGSEVATVNVVLDITTTTNVIAETKAGNHDNVVHVGGHSDSVEAGPGINDNGSGTIGLLEVAKQLTKYKVNNAVRFSWWAAEEQGLLGAAYFVEQSTKEDLDKIRLYLNFDMIGSPNYFYGVYDGDGSEFGTTGPLGSAQAEKLFEDYFKSVGIQSFPTDFSGRSDYGPFLENGVASGGLFTGAEELKTPEQAAANGGEAGVAYDVCYHAACDDITNIAWEAQVENTKAIAHAVAVLGVSTESLDVVAPTKRDNAKLEARSWSSYSPKYRGGHALF